MKRKYNILQIDAFTETPFSGNPAAVTFNPDLTDEEMQKIANEMNLSETAFISASDKADYNLRWFTPTTEVNLCGHATIASLHYLNEMDKINNRPRIMFETRSGILNCPVEGNYYTMEIPIPGIEEFPYNQEIIQSLGIDENAISKEHPFLKISSGYLYIYVKSLSAMERMEPDFKMLGSISKEYNLDAAAVFTLETYDKDSFAHSRFFTPSCGINEDPVTGSSNGPLMLVLEKLGLLKDDAETIKKIFEQGDIIGRKGRVKVTHSKKNNELYIGGNAVTVLSGELII